MGGRPYVGPYMRDQIGCKVSGYIQEQLESTPTLKMQENVFSTSVFPHLQLEMQSLIQDKRAPDVFFHAELKLLASAFPVSVFPHLHVAMQSAIQRICSQGISYEARAARTHAHYLYCPTPASRNAQEDPKKLVPKALLYTATAAYFYLVNASI